MDRDILGLALSTANLLFSRDNKSCFSCSTWKQHYLTHHLGQRLSTNPGCSGNWFGFFVCFLSFLVGLLGFGFFCFLFMMEEAREKASDMPVDPMHLAPKADT